MEILGTKLKTKKLENRVADKTVNILGIDPGINGALVLRTFDELTLCYPMPDNIRKLTQLITQIAVGYCPIVFIEHQQPLPSRVRGGVASFKLGENYGILRSAVLSNCLPLIVLRPSYWQSFFSLSYPGQNVTYAQKKRINKAFAESIFPGVKITLANADALIISEYGKRKMEESEFVRDLSEKQTSAL